LPADRRFSERQSFREPARRHQLVGLHLRRRRRGAHIYVCPLT
jgi:hypothetical protein